MAKYKMRRGNYITGGGNPIWQCSVCGELYGASMMPPIHRFCGWCGHAFDNASEMSKWQKEERERLDQEFGYGEDWRSYE